MRRAAFIVGNLTDIFETDFPIKPAAGFWLDIMPASFYIVFLMEGNKGLILACPISMFGADDERGASRDDVLAWRALTGGSFRPRAFPANHFFVRSQYQNVTRAVREDLPASAGNSHGATPC